MQKDRSFVQERHFEQAVADARGKCKVLYVIKQFNICCVQ